MKVYQGSSRAAAADSREIKGAYPGFRKVIAKNLKRTFRQEARGVILGSLGETQAEVDFLLEQQKADEFSEYCMNTMDDDYDFDDHDYDFDDYDDTLYQLNDEPWCDFFDTNWS